VDRPVAALDHQPADVAADDLAGRDDLDVARQRTAARRQAERLSLIVGGAGR